MPASTAVLSPNLGLIFDVAPEAVPPQGLVDGLNFRIKQGVIDTRLMGRSKFLANPLPGPASLIDEFLLSTGSSILIYATLTDILNHSGGTPVYITPAYVTGTIAVTNGSPTVTGTGTAWNTSIGSSSPRKNIRAGDFIFVGSATQNTVSPAGGWQKVLSVQSDTSLTLTANYAGATASGQTYTARQCFGGTLDNPWSTEYFPNAQDSGGSPIGDQWIATNGLDPIVSWNGVTTFAGYQSGLGFTCRFVYRYKDQLLYCGLTTNTGTAEPTAMTNSNAGQPYNVTTGIANTSIVTDDNFPIITVARLYDQLTVYTQSAVGGTSLGGQIIMATFIGGALGYAFRTVITGRAPLAINLVADFGYYHKFIGYEGEWLFNGIGLQFVGAHIWRAVSPGIDMSRINRSFCYFDEQQGDLIWALPYTTDVNRNGPETAFVEHYLEENVPQGHTPFSKRSFVTTTAAAFLSSQAAVTWNTLTNAWNTYSFRFNSNLLSSSAPLSLVGDNNGNILQLSAQDTDFNGTVLAEYVTFPPKIAADERHIGMIRRVYPFLQPGLASINLPITVTTYDRVGGAPKASATNTYNLGQTGPRFVNPFVAGRLAQVQVGSPSAPASPQPFVLEGYDWDAIPGGEVQ